MGGGGGVTAHLLVKEENMYLCRIIWHNLEEEKIVLSLA